MEISKNDLKKRYSSLDDNQIMDLYIDGGLTEEALLALKEEMDKRGLTSEHAKQKESQKEIEYTQEVKIDEEKLQQVLYEFEENQNLSLGMLSGTIAAGIGAAVWAVTTVKSGYQFGFMAVAVGGFVASAVRIFGKGITYIFGVVDAILSLLGCLAGNLFSSCAFISIQNEIPFFDILTRLNPQIIFEIMKETFSGMDLLFYGISICIGYQYSFRKLTEDELARIVQA